MFRRASFWPWVGAGLICTKRGIVTKDAKSQRVLGRCYELAGTLVGIHESHSLPNFELSDGSTAVACAKRGYHSLNKQVRLRQ